MLLRRRVASIILLFVVVFCAAFFEMDENTEKVNCKFSYFVFCSLSILRFLQTFVFIIDHCDDDDDDNNTFILYYF